MSWTHRVSLTRPLPSKGDTITIEAGLNHLQGNKTPYFSVTAEIRHFGRIESCGMLHEEILNAAPELATVMDLHLSDHRGVPMHCIANGLYHLGFGQYGTLNLVYAANHFRITTTQAEELRLEIISGGGIDRDRFAQFIREQRPRWKKEARAACNLLDAINDPETAVIPKGGWISEVFAEGKWSRNAIVWPDEHSAKQAGADLLSRWFVPTDSRATHVDEKPNRPTWDEHVADKGLPPKSVQV